MTTIQIKISKDVSERFRGLAKLTKPKDVHYADHRDSLIEKALDKYAKSKTPKGD